MKKTFTLKPILVFLLFLLSQHTVCLSQTGSSPTSTVSDVQRQMLFNQSNNNLSFEENKGQVQGVDAGKVRFIVKGNGLKVFILEDGIAYQYEKVHYPEGYDAMKGMNGTDTAMHNMDNLSALIRTETFRMDAILVGANKNAAIITEGKSSDYTQYYNHDVLEVHTFQKIIYKDIYPGIDWVLFFKDGNMEYEFVVHPGVDPSVIKIKYDYADAVSLVSNGSIQLTSAMGSIIDQKPVSFQGNDTVSTTYMLQGNEMQFSICNYDPSQILIIDPVVVWATYYGGTDLDYGYKCTTDSGGNVYMAGRTSSTINIASGGHQNIMGSAYDAYLVKFNSTGTRLWGTYYGGSGTEYGFNCIVDQSNNVYMVGETTSLTGISTFGVHQTTFGGTSDAFIVKFNSAGVRQWGSYYGGGSNDLFTSCSTDTEGNVYLAGVTASLTAIATMGAHQTVFGGGYYDAFLVKFNSSGVRQWGTYYGGSNLDRGISCAIDSENNVYLVGNTESNTAIAYSGHQNVKSTGYDGFMIKFNSSGERQWGTYYGGTSNDGATSISTAADGSVYLGGFSYSPTGISTVGSHQTVFGGLLDAFLAKFDTDGTRLWATYYGGEAFDDIGNISVDGNGNVYIFGLTASLTNIAYEGFQNTNAGFVDMLIAKFNAEGERIWGSYFGSTSRDGDGATSYGYPAPFSYTGGTLSTDGSLYLVGSTMSATGISLDGFQNTFGGYCDAMLVKIYDCQEVEIIPSAAGIVYVDSSVAVSGDGSSWANAAKEVADALKAAKTTPDIQEIWVAKGTYYPLYDASNMCIGSNPRNKSFVMVDDVDVYGGFEGGETTLGERDWVANPTTLSGDFDNNDLISGSGATLTISNNVENAYHVLIATGINNAIVDGFYVSGGNADIGTTANVNGNTIWRSNAGALYIYNASNITLRNNHFFGNSCLGMGGSTYILEASAIFDSVVFDRNIITGLDWGGAGLGNDNNAVVVLNYCQFTGNGTLSYGGGMLNLNSSPVLNHCDFIGNYSKQGGGINNNNNASTILNHCSFINNEAIETGGGICNITATSLTEPIIFNQCIISNNFSSSSGAGMYSSNSNVNVINSKVLGNNTLAAGAGFYNNTATIISITNSQITGNNAIGNGGGMYNNVSSPIITNTTIAGNNAIAGNGGAIRNNGGSSPIINNSIIHGNSTGVDNLGATDVPVITYSLVQGLVGGTSGNINGSLDPLFVNAPLFSTAPFIDGNYSLSFCSPALDVGNNTYVATIPEDITGADRIFNTTVDMGAYEYSLLPPSIIPSASGIVYVDSSIAVSGDGSSWATAIKEFADVLKAASSNPAIQQIWVAKGTYFPLYDAVTLCFGIDPEDKSFVLVDDVEIYGGFEGIESNINERDIAANPTILSGDIGIEGDMSDNVFNVIIGSGVTNVILDGLIIKDGNANLNSFRIINGFNIFRNIGAGLSINNSEIDINKCNFTNNTVNLRGGGIHIEESSTNIANSYFLNNISTTLFNNQGGGAIYFFNGNNLKIVQCNFISNTANDGGAIASNQSDSVWIDKCVFDDNMATDDGGAVYSNRVDFLQVTDNVFTSNHCNDRGGGLYNTDFVLTYVVNNTFFENVADNEGAAIGNQGALSYYIRNNIVYGNSSSISYSGGGAIVANVEYNIIEGGYAGTSNIDVNPLFVNSANPIGADGIWRSTDDGLQLSYCSPAIDIGNNAHIPIGITEDILNEMRIFNAIVDLGAYEFAAPIIMPIDSTSVLLCNGDSVLYRGDWYYTTGIYIDTVEIVGGCDSIYVLDLTLMESIIVNVNEIICEGESYLGYTTSGIYNDTFSTIAGCDSIRILGLLVHPSIPVTNLSASVCIGESYLGYTTTGIYTDTFTASTGCDSVRIIDLLVNENIITNIAETICEGGSFLGYNTTGIYQDTFTASIGCDSIRILNLTVNPIITSYISQSICEGESYLGYSIAGIYNDTFTSILGCDSVRILTLTVNPIITNSISQSICAGESYLEYSETGVYSDTFLSSLGCDSILILDLFVQPLLPVTNLSASICEGALYYGYSTTGIYTDTFISSLGCDSIRVIDLEVNESFVTNISESICAGESYLGYNTTGIYNDTFVASIGCDSVRILNLMVHPVITSSMSQSICEGESYLGYTIAGIYNDTFTSILGCDSIRILSLTVNPIITNPISQSICAGESYLGYSSTGIYIDTFSSSLGCDSIRILDLEVYPFIAVTNLSASICIGESYLGYTTTGTYTDTFTAATGCDSVRIIYLLVNENIITNINETICEGASYLGYSTTGIYHDTFTSMSGCDSVRIIELTVHPIFIDNISQSICEGESYLGYIMSGVYNDTFTTVAGCDSIRILDLIVHPIYVMNISETICEGESYLGYTSSGIYHDTFSSIMGCDSIRNLNLTVNPIPVLNLIDTICAGASYLGYSATGIYEDTFVSALGCDSIRIISLVVHPTVTTLLTASICQGETYLDYHLSGTYVDTFSTSFGCDSIRIIDLTVLDTSWTDIDTLVCYGVGFEWADNLISSDGIYYANLVNVAGCDSVVALNVSYSPQPITTDTLLKSCGSVNYSGTVYYEDTSFVDTFKTELMACDSIYRWVTIQVLYEPNDTFEVAICSGESYDFNGSIFTNSTIVTQKYLYHNGCDSFITMVLTVNDTPNSKLLYEPYIENKIDLCVLDSVRLIGEGALNYMYYNAFNEYLGTGEYVEVLLPNTINYFYVVGFNEFGCSDTIGVVINAESCCNAVMATAFSPNGDGLNDTYGPISEGTPQHYQFQIYNRFGQKVFESFNIKDRWNGTYGNGKAADVGVYFYTVSGTCYDGTPLKLIGEVTLVR